ncbi:glycosyltransferase family 4 protein [uncultured Winogradskyella sp.]|uniref:glycosyltransferase family 4 protein n=1 Tax=uncultured Winogradskyella sp. TaxID=395353 RepID=UPI00263A0246|nr:glycosyltransferase family 4 protein [uncultured Winogradskyella sp.]
MNGSKKLNIIIFDGSFKTTAFINRLILGLSRRHNVFVLGFNTDIEKKLEGVRYINLGNNTNKVNFLLVSLKLALQTVFYSGGIKRFIKLFNMLLHTNSLGVKKLNISNSILKIKPDIIHLQWPTLLPLVEDVISLKKYSIVLSQRGYHINVRASVDTEYQNYLKQWYPRLDGFHSVSNTLKVNSNLIHNSAKKIDKVVYSGLDLKSINFNKSYEKSEPLKLLSVGRPHWKKGYSTMIQACHLLKEKGLKINYTIIGAANDEELIYLIEAYNLSYEIKLTDKVSQDEVYEIMRRSSVFILPSLEEGIANVVIEAMAIGLPVISTNCGGMSELISHLKTGIITPLNSIDALVDAVVKFNELSLDEIEKMRVEARKKVEIQHSEEKMIDDMESLYRKCIDKPTV